MSDNREIEKKTGGDTHYHLGANSHITIHHHHYYATPKRSREEDEQSELPIPQRRNVNVAFPTSLPAQVMPEFPSRLMQVATQIPILSTGPPPPLRQNRYRPISSQSSQTPSQTPSQSLPRNPFVNIFTHRRTEIETIDFESSTVEQRSAHVAAAAQAFHDAQEQHHQQEQLRPSTEAVAAAAAAQQLKYNADDVENKPLFILDNSMLNCGCFAAVEATNMKMLISIDQFINDYAAKQQIETPYFPDENEWCLAMSYRNDRWYRAKPSKSGMGWYNLFYVDYGIMEKLPSDHLRSIDEILLFPCITTMCFIYGLPKLLQPNLVEKLKDLIQPYQEKTFASIIWQEDDALVKDDSVLEALGLL